MGCVVNRVTARLSSTAFVLSDLSTLTGTLSNRAAGGFPSQSQNTPDPHLVLLSVSAVWEKRI